METIKNYLDSMFRNLPQTEKVLRAKSELFQMMEDKYTELIKSGKSENEAVGTIISEFGNLEELASELGIADVFQTSRTAEENRRKVTFDEVKEYLTLKVKSGYWIGAGVLLCISSVACPIITDALNINDSLGVALMFVCIGLGILSFIFPSVRLQDYTFLTYEACSIDNAAREFVNNKRREYSSNYSILLSLGVLLCVLSIIPPMVFDGMGLLEDLSPAFMFLFAGAGVFLIVSSNIIKKSFDILLGVNTKSAQANSKNVKYDNVTVKTIMSVYWPTVTCIYLCFSFVTGKWYISWLIWPIAGVVSAIIAAIYGVPKDADN